CYWYDEPPESDYPFVAEGMKAIQECAPGLKRFITVHPVPALYNHVDIWVPWFSTVDSVTDRFRLRQAVGDEMWWYVCTGPKAPWPNNFVDHPAINHRIRPWLGEKYGIKGELYWQTTWYLGTSNLLHNPWTNAMSMQYMGWAMGNGDGVMLYPAAKQPPADITTLDFYNSQRWELTRESLEDGEYFWWLKQALQRAQARLGHNHPAVQEGHAAYQAVLKVTISAKDFERNPSKLHALRHRIGLAIESLNDGTPFFAKQPASQSALAGETVVLRAEALGWPLPQFQWQLDGIDVPNATNASLTLTQVTEAQAGSYTVRSVNQNGTALSSKAQLAVVVPAGQAHLPPRLLEQPSDRAAQPGGNAVFAVTAISTTPMAYQWHCNGIPLPQGTNSALLLTNLSSAHLGSYSVTISNPAGSISTPGAVLRFFSPQLSATVASNGVLLHLPPSNLPGKVQVSTNLSNWSDLIYHFPGTEPVTVLDPETATKPSRFYRLQLEQ
ncbi:MAG TPA: immunoglobulin domain-containing protein, partial [Clostridia bacterium]|nr:immunoglobulin domain-containing protein [Clostridia bacterium]